MKRSEAIEKYDEQIKAAMIQCHDEVLNSMGLVVYYIYVWEDGKVQTLIDVPDGNRWLKPDDSEEKELFYVTTIQEEDFDPWEYTSDPKPETEEEQEAAEARIIEDLSDEFKSLGVHALFDEILDYAIEDDERRKN